MLRPSTPADAPELLRLLLEPAVAAWWGDNDLASVTEEIAGELVLEVDGQLAGLLECHEETEPMYPEVAFDIFLGSAWHGRGLGRQALRLAINHFIARGHHRFTIDPAVDNVAAVRCYSAVGFKPVGILRQAERVPGTAAQFRDSLLMDLLASELPDQH